MQERLERAISEFGLTLESIFLLLWRPREGRQKLYGIVTYVPAMFLHFDHRLRADRLLAWVASRGHFAGLRPDGRALSAAQGRRRPGAARFCENATYHP